MYDTHRHKQPTLYEGWFDPSPQASKTPLSVSDLLEVVYDALSERAYIKAYKDEKDEYDDEVKELIAYSDNKKTKKHYQRYEQQYIEFIDKRNACINSTANVANFLNFYVTKRNNKGSVWNIYSVLNNYFRREFNIDLNTDQKLRHVMKNLSKHHVLKKSDIIPTEKVRELLEFHLDDDIPEGLSCKIWTSLMYFGLLRNKELFEIQVEHIEYSKKTGTLNVNCLFETKHRENGFSFFIPDYLHASFLKYYTQLAKKTGHFLKKPNKTNKKRTRNMGSEERRVGKECRSRWSPYH